MPSVARPSATRCTDAIAVAVTAAWRVTELVTAVARPMRSVTVAAIATGAVLLAATTLFLNRTDVGLQMRAAASDFRTARTLGVRADRVIVTAFAISGFLAAAALLLFVVQRPVITPDYGLQIGIVALVGVVVGGMDRLVPATLGVMAANHFIVKTSMAGQEGTRDLIAQMGLMVEGVEIVVDDHVVGLLASDRFLGLGLAEAGEHLVAGVAAPA